MKKITARRIMKKIMTLVVEKAGLAVIAQTMDALQMNTIKFLRNEDTIQYFSI